jgi:hypothetical protein
MDKFLWKMIFDCGRSGCLEGLFIATQEEIDNLIGSKVYFGEVLGKHSEVYGAIEEGEITKVDLDSEIVEKVSAILGDTWSGYNPLEYINYDCEQCGYSYYKDEFNFEKNMCIYCVEEIGS